jgi:transcriptional regulator with XRE-family HTH domain
MSQLWDPGAASSKGASRGLGDGPTPVVQRRRLRTELRKARQEASLTQEQVAAAMDWSLSKIIRIENGSVSISTNDLKALLRHYQIVDEDRAGELVALARAARERSWWSVYRDVASPRLLQFIEYEAAAVITRNFEPLLIPGLLQTEEYARAVIRQFYERPTAERVDALMKLRMKRQELLSRAEPPLLFFILDEAVIRRLVGGKAVMRRQIRQLTEMVDRPNVTVEVVPFSAGVHAGMNGSFVVLEFPDAEDDDVLYLESTQGELIKPDLPEEILTYRETFEQLREMSLGPEGSVTYLSKVADEMT